MAAFSGPRGLSMNVRELFLNPPEKCPAGRTAYVQSTGNVPLKDRAGDGHRACSLSPFEKEHMEYIPMGPRAGDVLVSSPTATVEYEMSIVPARASRVCPNHDTAIAQARELANLRRLQGRTGGSVHTHSVSGRLE